MLVALQEADVPPSVIEQCATQGSWSATHGGMVLEPPLAVVLTMQPGARQKLYGLLARVPENKDQKNPIPISPQTVEGLVASGFNGPIVQRFKGLLYGSGPWQVFADLPAMLMSFADEREGLRFATAIMRAESYVVRLKIDHATDVDTVAQGVSGQTWRVRWGARRQSAWDSARAEPFPGHLFPSRRQQRHLRSCKNAITNLLGRWGQRWGRQVDGQHGVARLSGRARRVDNAQLLDLDKVDGWIPLVNACDANRDRVVVINTTARSNASVASFGGTLITSLGDLDRSLITLWAINRQRDSLELLKDFMDAMTQSRVHVLRNCISATRPRSSSMPNLSC